MDRSSLTSKHGSISSIRPQQPESLTSLTSKPVYRKSIGSSQPTKEEQSINKKEEVNAWLTQYRIAMDRLTVDKLLTTNLTGLAMRMSLAKHSRTALSPVVGEVMRAVISRASSESAEQRMEKIKINSTINFYKSTDYTVYRTNSLNRKERSSKSKTRKVQNKYDEMLKHNESWYGLTNAGGNFINRWQSPLSGQVYCSNNGWLEPPLVDKKIKIKDKRGEVTMDADGNELFRTEQVICSPQAWIRENGQFSVRTFGTMGVGEMELNSPMDLAISTKHLPKEAICRMAITDTGNNRVQIWTLMKGDHNDEIIKFDGLVGLNTLFQEPALSDDEYDDSIAGTRARLIEEDMEDQSGKKENKILTPEEVIKRQELLIARKLRADERVKIRSTFGSRKGQFANPRGVSFGNSKTDANRIFVTDNSIDKHQGSPRVQVIDIDGFNEAKVSYVIDNSSLGDASISSSLIAPVYGVKPGGGSEFVYTDSNGMPILEEQKDRIIVTVAANQLDGFSSNDEDATQISGYCWTFPRHVREFPLETMMLCCLEPSSTSNEKVRAWFDVINREPKTENAKFCKNRRERVALIQKNMDKKEYSKGIKAHFALHYFQHELVEHVTGTATIPTLNLVQDKHKDIEEAFNEGFQKMIDDPDLSPADSLLINNHIFLAVEEFGEDVFEGEGFFGEHYTDGGSSSSARVLLRSNVQKTSRIPPTHHVQSPAALSLKFLRLICFSRYLRDFNEMAKLVKTMQKKYPFSKKELNNDALNEQQRPERIEAVNDITSSYSLGASKEYSKHLSGTDSDSEVESGGLHLDQVERTTAINQSITQGCVVKLKELVAEMMFDLLLRQIHLYDQLEDTFIFEPYTQPGQTFIVPRSAIRGTSMQAYSNTGHRTEIGNWIEGTVVGLDRETGLYAFESEEKIINSKPTSIQQLEHDDPKRFVVRLIPRSKLRTKVPVSKNLFSLPWGTCQAKHNGHGHLVVSDNELDCLHVFDGCEYVSDNRTAEEKDEDPFKDYTRKYLYTIGRRGTLRGEFHSPKGICFDHANRIIVADCNNNRIQGFEYLEEAGGSYSIPLHPGIAPNHKKGGRWVCTFVYPEEDHSKRGNVGTPGTRRCALKVTKDTHEMPHLSRPSDVCIDSHENIIVADTGNCCIRVLQRKVYYGPNEQVEPATVDRKDLWMYKRTLMGKLVRVWPYIYVECIATWGCRGFGPGTFIAPTSVQYYQVKTVVKASKKKRSRERIEDRYLVVDQGSHNITQFTLISPDKHLTNGDALILKAVKLQSKRKNKMKADGGSTCVVM